MPGSAASDPSVLQLVPASSRRRNVLLVAAGLAVLALAWFSPTVLRPSLGHSSGGSWSAIGPPHQVLAIVDLEPEVWPSARIVSVGDVPGAEVERAWIVGPADAAEMLPQRIGNGDHTQLAVLWHITDCARLQPTDWAEVRLQSALHTSSTDELPDTASPGFDVDTLRREGVC